MAAASLAAGATAADAGRAAGVSDRTIRRRLNDPEFLRLVDLQRAAIVHEVRGRVVGAASDAAAELHRLATAANSEAARVSACRALLDYTLSPRFRLITEPELNRIVTSVVETALAHMPVEKKATFVRELRAIAETSL